MKIDLLDILVPPGGALIAIFFSWATMRAIQAGRPLTYFQKDLLFYGFFFLAGAAYFMLVEVTLSLPQQTWVLLSLAWGALLGRIAWQRYQRTRRSSKGPRLPSDSSSQ